MIDLDIIEDAIYDIEENEKINAENIKELACLYIVKAEQLKSNRNEIKPDVEDELEDILPYYRKYCDVKRRYQLHELSEEAVVNAISKVCREISDLIATLYSGTDLGKERRQIIKMLSTLQKTYEK